MDGWSPQHSGRGSEGRAVAALQDTISLGWVVFQLPCVPRALAWGPSAALFMSTLLVKVGLPGPQVSTGGYAGRKKTGDMGERGQTSGEAGRPRDSAV